MSDFPEWGTLRQERSADFIKQVPMGAEGDSRLVLSRKKEAYLMDLDGQKFVDYHLEDGGVIAGHSHRTLTQFAKDGMSIGQTGGFFCRSHLRLQKHLCAFASSRSAVCFGSEASALLALLKAFQPQTIAVNSRYLQDMLLKLGVRSDLAVSRDGHADLLLFEPVDMESSLENADYTSFQAKNKVCYEGRTAFRLPGAALSADGIRFFGRSLANGLPFAAITGAGESFPGEAVPAYLAESVVAVLNLLGRKKELVFEGDSRLVLARRGGILKLARPLGEEELLPFGVYARGDILYLSYEHTIHDQARLFKGLDALPTGGRA